MSLEVAVAKAAAAVASNKRGRTAIATIVCSVIMLFLMPLIVYMGVISNMSEIEIDMAQAQESIIQHLRNGMKYGWNHSAKRV